MRTKGPPVYEPGGSDRRRSQHEQGLGEDLGLSSKGDASHWRVVGRSVLSVPWADRKSVV